MTAPIQSARDYSLALYGALLAAGIASDHAIDCARNVAQAACLDAEVNVFAAVCARLYTQGVLRRRVEAGDACACIPRWIEPRDADTSPGGADVFRPESAR